MEEHKRLDHSSMSGIINTYHTTGSSAFDYDSRRGLTQPVLLWKFMRNMDVWIEHVTAFCDDAYIWKEIDC